MVTPTHTPATVDETLSEEPSNKALLRKQPEASRRKPQRQFSAIEPIPPTMAAWKGLARPASSSRRLVIGLIAPLLLCLAPAAAKDAEAPGTPQRPATAAPSGLDAFGRMMQLPAACIELRKLGDLPSGWNIPTRSVFNGQSTRSPACQLMMDCSVAFSTQPKAIFEYLGKRPLLYDALKHQGPPAKGYSLDGALGEFSSRSDHGLDLFRSKLETSNIGCSDAFYVVNVYAFRLDKTNLFGPTSFESLAIIAQQLISKLRAQYGVDISSYKNWLPYAAHYSRADELSRLKGQYEAAYNGPDIEALLAAKTQFQKAMAGATDFETLLSQQTDTLASLNDRLSEIVRDASQGAISKSVAPTLLSALTKDKAELERLRDLPATERGDASEQIKHFEIAIQEADSDVKQAQTRLDALNQQTSTLASLSARASDIARQITQDPLSKIIAPTVKDDLDKVKAELEGLRDRPAGERGDASEPIKRSEIALDSFDSALTAAKARSDDLSALETKRQAALRGAEDALTFFSQMDAARRLHEPTLPSQIQTAHDSLAKLGSIPLWERQDYSDALASMDRLLDQVQSIRQDSQAIKDVIERATALAEAVRL